MGIVSNVAGDDGAESHTMSRLDAWVFFFVF